VSNNDTTASVITPDADDAPSVTPSRASANRERIAGLLGAGIALATTELVAGIWARVPSLIESVGEAVIDLSPSAVVKFGISTFGTNDKPALAVGIVVISVVAGAALGRSAKARPWFAPIAMSVAAGVGIAAAIRNPLVSGGWAVIAAVTGVVAGTAALRYILGLGTSASAPAAATEDRRRFVLSTAGGLGVVLAAPLIGRRLAKRHTVEAARAQIDLSAIASPSTLPPVTTVPRGSAIEGLTPLYVPNDEFYRIDTAFTIPQVDPATWSMRIKGMVDNELTFTLDDLLARATTQADVTLSCVSNRIGGDLVGNARWTGVPLQDLLDEAGVQPGGTQIMSRSVDDFTAGFPTSLAGDGRTALVAIGMNGEPLPTRHGFPARLVVAGIYGYVSATKWLSEIEINDFESVDGYWIPRGWSKEGPIKTQSRIDVPREQVAAGTVTIAGVAWAPIRGISAVEVRIDDGPWTEVTLGPDIGEESWIQWWHDVELVPGRYVVTVRATDGTGAVQTDVVTRPAPNGAAGHHSKTISVAEV